MTVKELRDTLDKIISEDSEVMLIHDGDNFYDGRKITGIMIMHHFIDDKDECKVFIEEE